MLFKTVLFATVLLVYVAATPLQNRSSRPLALVSIISLEEPCVRQGGICLPVSDCEPENQVQLKGVLCPQQRHLDVDCCYMN